MEIKEFIEKAIEGGYLTLHNYRWHKDIMLSDAWAEEVINELVLDPKAWEAVGKIEKWDESNDNSFYIGVVDGKDLRERNHPVYRKRMHNMIDHITVNKGTIKSYIKTL